MRALHTAAIMFAFMGTSASAATYLCAETGSSGFNWRGGEWVATTYTLEQYIVRTLGPEEPIASMCFERMAQEGRTREPKSQDYGTYSADCFALYRVGEEPYWGDVNLCTIQWSEELQPFHINCANTGFVRYAFVPSGEFVATRTYAAPVSDPLPDNKRDSLALSIGKCSIIAP